MFFDHQSDVAAFKNRTNVFPTEYTVFQLINFPTAGIPIEGFYLYALLCDSKAINIYHFVQLSKSPCGPKGLLPLQQKTPRTFLFLVTFFFLLFLKNEKHSPSL